MGTIYDDLVADLESHQGSLELLLGYQLNK